MKTTFSVAVFTEEKFLLFSHSVVVRRLLAEVAQVRRHDGNRRHLVMLGSDVIAAETSTNRMLKRDQGNAQTLLLIFNSSLNKRGNRNKTLNAI